MQMYVPLRWMGTAVDTQASANTVDNWPQVGFSNPTVRYQSTAKKVEMRPLVRSKN